MNKFNFVLLFFVQIYFVFSSTNEESNTLNYDIIIVGSGLTGLTAAKEIKKNNPSVSLLILEASDSSGGRIRGQPLSISKNDSTKKQMVDIGAMWISPSHSEIISLAKEYNLDLYSQAHTCGDRIVFVNNNLTQNFRFKRQSDWESVPGKSLSDLASPVIFNTLSSQSCEDFVNSYSLTESTKDGVFRFLQTFYDSPADSISALQLMLTLSSENEDIQTILNNQGHGNGLIMKNSLQSLIDELTKDLLINYHQEVMSVNILNNDGTVIENNTITGSQVFVTTSNGQKYLAQEVIIAISPQSTGKIIFGPELNQTEKDFLSNYKSQGEAYYFVSSFETPFWRSNNHSGQIIFSDQTGSNPLYWLTTFDISEDNNCQVDNNVGLMYGIAHFTREMSEAERIEAYTNVLEQNLGNTTLKELIEIKDIQWVNVPHINGLVGAIPVNGIKNITQITNSPFLKRVHFASPELSLQSMGSPNGAVCKGKEVAQTVMQEMTNLPEVKLQDDSNTNIIVGGIINNETYLSSTELPIMEENNTTMFPYSTSSHYPEEVISISSTIEQSFESTTPNANAFVYNTSQHYADEVTQIYMTTDSLNEQTTDSQTTERSQTIEELNDNNDKIMSSTTQTIESTSLDEELQTSTEFQYSTTPHYLPETTNQYTSTNIVETINNEDDVSSTTFSYDTSSHYAEDIISSTTNDPHNNQMRDDIETSTANYDNFIYNTSAHYSEDMNFNSTNEISNINQSFNNEDSSTSSVTQKYVDAINKVYDTKNLTEINGLILQIQSDIPNVSKSDSLQLIKQLNELIDMLVEGLQNSENI
uniref:monoamine oxidase n=1 Tax=Parastrongyloides trichosuri TaxID=131310 RepID=A0A0N4ZUR2_PARTI